MNHFQEKKKGGKLGKKKKKKTNGLAAQLRLATNKGWIVFPEGIL